MRQHQGRAWRGACKTFATLAAGIRICVNVSAANKTRMKDLTVACRESGHSFLQLHRLEQESPGCTTFPGSCQDTGICSEGFNSSEAAQEGAQAHGQFQWQCRTNKQEPAALHPTTCAWSWKGSGNLSHRSSTRTLPVQSRDTVLFLRDIHHVGLPLPREVRTPVFDPGNTGAARALIPCSERVQVPGMLKK